DADLRGLLNITDDRVEFAVALRTLAHRDVLGVHANGFESYAVLVAVLAHALQFVEIPANSCRRSTKLRRQMVHAVAQNVLPVFVGRDAGPHHAVVIAANVHRRVATRRARRLCGRDACCDGAGYQTLAEVTSLHMNSSNAKSHSSVNCCGS